jgi:hypothetical protein
MSKHTARQCRVLKKFRRPLTAAHRRRLNQESSPDRLAFQVAHTTISPTSGRRIRNPRLPDLGRFC